MSTQTTVCHMSSVHRADDVRIFYKECRSLAAAGFATTLIANWPQDERRDGVQIRGINASSRNRLARMILGSIDVLRRASTERADVYHLHDPELIPVGGVLRLMGKRVVYDVHENVPAQILTKGWIPSRFRRVAAAAVSQVEQLAGRLLSGVVAAREDAGRPFPVRKTVVVENYPMISEFASPPEAKFRERPVQVTYVGGITAARGIREIVEAMAILGPTHGVRLALGGTFDSSDLAREVRSRPGWMWVEELGWVGRTDYQRVLNSSRIGLLLLHDIPNHATSTPTKLFDYMAAGLPIVASNIRHWTQYVTDLGTGIMVDPHDPQQIAGAIVWLLEHPDEAEAMGRRGREAVLARYTWESQADKLVDFYRTHILA